MNITARVLWLATLLALGGCDHALFDDGIRKSVREKLKDPDSAKWGEKLVYKDQACIEVNSKNSYGGYGGKESAWLIATDGKGEHWYMRELNASTCNQGALEALVQRADAEKAFEAEILALLKSRGLTTTTLEILSSIAADPKTVNPCLVTANQALARRRLALESKGAQQAEWNRDAEQAVATLRSSNCG